MKLSISIPTRNRARLLGPVLDRIILQANDEVEIVVVDGASTDNTEEEVRIRQYDFPRIQYFRREVCIGVDPDILKSVELANGEYCWLLSDDDYLEEGSISYVLGILEENSAIAGVTLNYLDYDRELRFPVNTNPASSGDVLKSDRLFVDPEECFSLLGLQLSFISTQIVNTKLWNGVVSEYDLGPYMNDWLMVYIIGRMMQKKPKWLYSHRVSVRRRVDNDSFRERVGVYKRQIITHVAYRDTIRSLFGEKSEVYGRVFYALLCDRMARSLAVIKANGASISLQLKLFNLYTRYYKNYALFWTTIVPLFFVPNFAFRIIRRLYFKRRSRQI